MQQLKVRIKAIIEISDKTLIQKHLAKHMKNIKTNFTQVKSPQKNVNISNLRISYPWQNEMAPWNLSCLSGFSPKYLTTMFAPILKPTAMKRCWGSFWDIFSTIASNSAVSPVFEVLLFFNYM